jgi:rare lipoprotein A
MIGAIRGCGVALSYTPRGHSPTPSGVRVHDDRCMRSLIAITSTALAATAMLIAFPPAEAASDVEAVAVQKSTPPDRSGKKRVGKASYYHPMFNGRKMAGGKRFDPNGANAASKTLPLGTVARVTNLDNGKSAVVAIEDRGPYVADRIVDVSPKTAEAIGIKDQGVAKVEVTPISVPLPDGSVLVGDARREGQRLTAR